ncbi:MAG: IS200/IS605 family accessory protein TnpB-related protein, partial [Waterburya sp.]
RSSTNYELAVFSTGKQYNCDLSASYNIGARFILKLLGGNSPQDDDGKSTLSSPRSRGTLSMLWVVPSIL